MHFSIILSHLPEKGCGILFAKPNRKTAMCMYNAIVHHDEDGGYWAEVPALPGCPTEVRENLPKAIRFHLAGLNEFEIPAGAELAQVSV